MFEVTRDKGNHGKERIMRADDLEELHEKLGAKIGDQFRLPGEKE